jgi:pimeloyl-ACP methyl ester carboxylesterase
MAVGHDLSRQAPAEQQCMKEPLVTNFDHRTGTVRSGDVDLFYRAFGSNKDRTPIVILHGSNYFDSYDWIEVASQLGAHRQVVAFDHRGFGQSSWSPNKDYSLDALFGDIANMSGHFGWQRPAILGHSVSGRLAIFYAAFNPQLLSQLIVVDTALGKGNPGKYNVSVGNEAVVFKTVGDAMASLAEKENPPRFSLDRSRAELALTKVAAGYTLKRDPDHRNTQSQAPGAERPRFADVDSWDALRNVTCPITFIRGARSDRNKAEHYDRISKEFPHIRVETIDSRHDVAFEAPDQLVAVVNSIMIDTP